MSPAPSPLANEIADEREALEDLLASKGWRVFEAHVAREWQGIGYYTRMNAVMDSPTPEGAMVLHKASKEITKTVLWPKRRLAELTETKA